MWTDRSTARTRCREDRAEAASGHWGARAGLHTVKAGLALALLACAVPVLFARPAAGGARRVLPHLALEPAKPNPWLAVARREVAALDRAAEALISVAKDRGRKEAVRRKAILLLGTIGNERALKFLVANVGLIVPLDAEPADAHPMLDRPCAYALMGVHNGRTHWNAVPLIIAALCEAPRLGDETRRDLAAILHATCGGRRALVILRQALNDAKSPDAASNVKAALDRVETIVASDPPK